MLHLFNRLPADESANGTSFYDMEIVTTVQNLKRVLGDPDFDDNDGQDKVNFEWDRKTANGTIFTVYDWKEYRRLKETERISFHIGTEDEEGSIEAAKEIRTALANLPYR